MFSPNSLSLNAFLIVLLLYLPFALSQLSIYEYRTLNDPLTFETQAKAWTSSTPTTTDIVSCYSNQLLRLKHSTPTVPGVLTLELNDLPQHWVVYIVFTFYEFAGQATPNPALWNTLQVATDTLSGHQYTISMNPSFQKTRACGPVLGFVFETRIYGILRPTGNSGSSSTQLKLQIRHDFEDSYVTAFGIRDVVISLAKYPTTSNYYIDQTTSAMQPNANLLCPTALQYKSSLCESCDIACGSCHGIGRANCFECADGYGYDGDICVKCHLSCATCTGKLSIHCTSCPSGKILTSDHTCIPAPVVIPGTGSQTLEASIKGGFFDNLLVPPSEPGTVTFVTFAKFMQYVRQLQVKLPPRLEKMSASKGRSVLSLHVQSSIEETIYSWFTPRSLAVVLHKQVLHERFLANFGGDIFVIGIIIVSGILFSLAKLVAVRFKLPTLEAILEKFQTITRWNLGLMLFGLYIDDIILYSAVEFKTIQFDSPSANLSFAMCVIVDILAIAFLVSTVLLARKSAQLKKEAESTKDNSKYEAFLYKWRSFQLYFRGFNEKPQLNQLFFILYISRAALPMLLATALESAPVVQAVFQMMISVVIVFYALICKPLRKKINQYQLVIIETMILALNICVLALAAMNNLGINDTPGCVFLGDAIIIGNVLINLIVLIILVIKFAIMLKEIHTLYKANRKQAAISCLHLFVPPLQQCALGFEELLEDIQVYTPQKQINKTAVIRNKTSRVAVTPIPSDFNPKLVNKATVDEVTDQQSTERLGQSSSRLWLGSQGFNQSQVFNQSQGIVEARDISLNDASVEMPSPKLHKKKANKGKSYQSQQREYNSNGSSVLEKKTQEGYSISQSNFSSVDGSYWAGENSVLPKNQGYKQNL